MWIRILVLIMAFFTSLTANEWKRIYFASFPRSGNHWVRYLVEEVTQVATGSVYLDQIPPHLTTPFPWGGFAAEKGYLGACRYPSLEDPVLIKTHFPSAGATKYDLLPALKTVRMIRHPIDALYSQAKHANSLVGPDWKMSTSTLKVLIRYWKRFQEYWNKQQNVVTVRYEDLYNSPKETLREILEAMGVQAEEEDLDRAIFRHGPEGALLKSLRYYTPEQVQLLRDSLGDLLEMYGYSI